MRSIDRRLHQLSVLAYRFLLQNSSCEDEAWAEYHLLLATEYVHLRDHRPENIKHAIDHLESARTVIARTAAPEKWATIERKMGEAYFLRPDGDRVENVKRAIEHYLRALRAIPQGTVEWATLERDLAGAIFWLGRNEIKPSVQIAYLTRSRAHYTLAQEVYTLADHPAQWALIESRLGMIEVARFRYDRRDERIQQAIRHLQQTLDVYTRLKVDEKWVADAHNCLGSAYSERVAGGIAQNQKRAIDHYLQALEIYTRRSYPDDWRGVQNNLGAAYAELSRVERAGNVKKAIHHCHQALDAAESPANRLPTLRSLGTLHFWNRNWAEARAVYMQAFDAGDALLSEAYTPASRRDAVSEATGLYTHAAYALLKMGRPAESLRVLERGQTRLLDETLALASADLTPLPAAQREALRRERIRLHQLEAEYDRPHDDPTRRSDTELSGLLQEARANLKQIVQRVRMDRPDFIRTDLDLPEILSLIPPNGALVIPLVTSHGGAVILLPHGITAVGTEHIVFPAPSVGDELFQLTERGPRDAPRFGGWMAAYLNFLREEGKGESFERWKAVIETGTHRLWHQLMGPIHERLLALGLTSGAQVILIPQGRLRSLPLHAAWREVDGVRRYFLDDFTVSFAPSASVLCACQQRLQEGRRAGRSLLATINPTGDLPYASPEGKSLLRLFPPSACQVLEEDQATQAAVIAKCTGRAYLHFACHGRYDWRDAMRSGLKLADGSLDSAEIPSPQFDLSAARLVTLSACETGLTDLRQPDQYLGLPAAFLQAGVPTAITTLWAVPDLSTMLLMERFYKHHLDGMAPAAALRAAQIWLRDATAGDLAQRFEKELDLPDEDRLMPYQDASTTWQRFAYDPEEDFADPIHWAAFTCTGAIEFN